MSTQKTDNARLWGAYNEIVAVIQKRGYDTADDKVNMEETAKRAAKALERMITRKDDLIAQVRECLDRVFPGEACGMVVQKGITVDTICPHHLMPVIMEVSIGWLPSEHAKIGLSKPVRVAKLLGLRPVLQEVYTADLADVLSTADGFRKRADSGFPRLDSDGSIVVTKALHTCMACRGVKERASTVVSECRGVFVDSETRDEFFRLLQHG